MKILLDENMPHNLVKALRMEGHEVESVHTFGIAGVKNGELYKIIKYVLVTLPQKAQDLFVKDFIAKFSKTDWPKHVHGNAWPKEGK